MKSTVHPELRTFERHPATDALIEALRPIEPGGTITYQSLSDSAGEPVVGGNGHLNSARRALAREEIHFHTIRGEGLRRATDESLVEEAPHRLAATRRKVRKDARRLACSRYDKLDSDARMKRTAYLAMGVALTSMTGKKQTKRLEAAARDKHEMSRQDAMRILAGNGNAEGGQESP